MISHNRADLIGRLTRDPEIRQTSKGIPIAHAGLALNRLRTSGEETTLIEFIARNEHALYCAHQLTKRCLIFTQGHPHKSAGVAQTEHHEPDSWSQRITLASLATAP